MSRQLVYLPEVSQDFIEAFDYYDSFSPGRGGSRFESAFRLALQEIERGFVTHARHFEFYHRVFVGDYPYNLYYRLVEEKAVIAGLLYARFAPERIQQTLNKWTEEKQEE